MKLMILKMRNQLIGMTKRSELKKEREKERRDLEGEIEAGGGGRRRIVIVS